MFIYFFSIYLPLEYNSLDFELDKVSISLIWLSTARTKYFPFYKKT